jgi:hypothetical protein
MMTMTRRASLLAVLVLLFAPSVFAQSLDLVNETPVSDPVVGEVPGQAEPHIASDGNGFLAVWTDRRQVVQDFVYASPLTADGAVLHPHGVRIAEGHAIDVVWSGRAYLVYADTPQGQAILALDRDGALLARHPLESYSMHYAIDSAMAANGANALLVGAGTGGAGIGVRLDADGRPFGRISFANFVNPGSLSVASNGSDYLVAYERNAEVVAQHVPSIGGPSAPVAVGSGHTNETAVAGNGDSYLVVWSAGSIVARSVDRMGTPNAPQRMIYAVSAGSAGAPRIAWRDGEYVIAHTHHLDVYETHANAAGEVITAPRAFALGGTPDVAALNGISAVVWNQHRGGVRAATARERFESASLLTRGVVQQSEPQLTAARNSLIAAWHEQGEIRIAALGGKPQVVASGPGRLSELCLVSHGELVWVLWVEGTTEFRVRRYTPELQPIDAAPLAFPLPRDLYSHSWQVAAGENSLILTWRTNGIYSARFVEHDIIAMVLRANGPGVDAVEVGIAPSQDMLQDLEPAPAWNGSEFVVAWIHLEREPWWQFPEPVPNSILAVRVSRDGVRVDPAPIVVASSMTDDRFAQLQAAPAIGGGVILAWQDLDETRVAVFRGDARPPSRALFKSQPRGILTDVVPFDNSYVLIWWRWRTPTSPAEIHLARINAQLALEEERAIVEEPVRVYGTAALANTLFVAYVRPVLEPGFEGVWRAFIRFGSLGPRRRPVR